MLIMTTKRKRNEIDYKKLHDALFQEAENVEEDKEYRINQSSSDSASSSSDES